MRTVPSVPTANPAFLKASGIAKIPVPTFPFRRWIIVSQFLQVKQTYHKTVNYIVCYLLLLLNKTQ